MLRAESYNFKIIELSHKRFNAALMITVVLGGARWALEEIQLLDQTSKVLCEGYKGLEWKKLMPQSKTLVVNPATR